MYNPDRKQAFIRDTVSELPSDAGLQEKLFLLSEPYEIAAGADLGEMTGSVLMRTVYEMLRRMFPGNNRKTAEERKTAMEVLRRYGKWNVEHHLWTASFELRQLEDPVRIRYRYQFVSSPAHLKLYLDDLFPLDPEYATLNDVYQSFFWLGFSGLPEDEAWNLTTDRMDFSTMTVKTDGGVYPLYAEAVPPLRNAVYSTSMRINHPGYKTVSMRDRVREDRVLRCFRVLAFHDFRNSITIGMKKRHQGDFLTPYLNYRNVLYSGVFYRTLLQEMSGARLDYDEIAVSAYLTDQSVNGSRTSSNFQTKRKNVMRDYGEWKDIFLPK